MYLSNHNNGLAQKNHYAKLCSIMNKDSLDGYFQHTLAALSHAHSTNYCCLELDDVIRDNKHAVTMMLDTRSTISRGSKAKNFTITSRHHCCLIFCWLNETKKLLSEFQCLVFFGCLVPDVHEGGHENGGDTRTGYTVVEAGCANAHKNAGVYTHVHSEYRKYYYDVMLPVLVVLYPTTLNLN